MPIEPEPSVWSLPNPRLAPAAFGDLISIGADLEPGTLLKAYRTGLFPMPLPDDMAEAVDDVEPIGWWSPDPRGILPLDGLKVSRSLRKSCALYEIRVNTAFTETVVACGDPARPHGWIDDSMIAAYTRLFELGWAHSVEAWNIESGELAGGLYGVAIGAFFSGESMFYIERDTSKVALVGLVEMLRARNFKLLDVQWQTDHLESLGVIAIDRDEYLDLLSDAVNASAGALSPIG